LRCGGCSFRLLLLFHNGLGLLLLLLNGLRFLFLFLDGLRFRHRSLLARDRQGTFWVN
jgi:hypothetical protein